MALLLLFVLGATGAAAQNAWSIQRDAWTPEDERRYEAFVQALGESDCRTVQDCLAGPANPYRATDPRGLRFFADCADFPYVLRAYFAGKHGLPFSYVAGVAPARADEPGRDIRYTWHGNRVTARTTPFATAAAPGRVLRDLANTISTASFRVDHRTVAPDHLHDLYPVALTRESIRPGVVFYDPQGHVSTVYRVDDDGTVHFIDAHPDNSVTRRAFGAESPRQDPKLGGGFLAWRPQRLEGRRVVLAPNEALADYSLVQYVGTRPHPTDWQQGTFAHNGREVADFHAYVRLALMRDGFRLDPVAELRRAVAGLCTDLRARADAVELARRDGLTNRPAPARLPANIYGADGDWETYSTPARDARLRASFVSLRRLAGDLLARHETGDPTVGYDGFDLATDLFDAYREETAACSFAYTNSRGEAVTLTFDDVSERLFALSFDPHHCPERRWGAEGAELATCPDGPEKQRWYAAQQRLRHVTERDAQARMGWTLAELERAAFGPETAPVVDVLAVLGPVGPPIPGITIAPEE